MSAALCVIAFALYRPQARAEGIPESPTNTIGYDTVADALAALHRKPGVRFSEQGGWTIAEDAGSSTLWTFTQPGHPAHPAAVKRSIVTKGGASYVDMNVHCESDKLACDKLVAEFQELNRQMIESVQSHAPAAAASTPHTSSVGADPAKSPEEVNVTSDSSPGWIPTAQERAAAPRIARDFLAAIDTGLFRKAYDMNTDGQRALETFEQFRKRASEFNAQAGPVIERRILKVSWTKDPSNAPAPGIYVAIDFASRFEKIDRHCGYLVLYRRDGDAQFQITREEDNYMTNASAHQIETEKSPRVRDEIWGQLSRNCPNYRSDRPDR